MNDWLDTILYAYPYDKASLNMQQMTLQAIRQNIFDESSVSDGDRVQTSGTSDPTAAKALKCIIRTQDHQNKTKVLKLKVNLIENALSALTEEEFNVISRLYFNRQTYAAIDEQCRISRRTVQRLKRGAMGKLDPLLAVVRTI